MQRLAPLHWKKLVCAFGKLGYEFSRQESSHIMLKILGKRPLVIPKYESVGLDITILLVDYKRLETECGVIASKAWRISQYYFKIVMLRTVTVQLQVAAFHIALS